MTMRPTREEIASLLARFDSSSWDEMDLRIGDFRLRLSNDAIAPAPVGAMISAVAPAVAAKPASESAKREVSESRQGEVAIRAPSLGRFWRKPKPTEPPFIEIGAHVKPGDVVCIVEVMKLFTQVKAEVAGKIISCPLTDGEMVEFDDVLFVIQP
jgi:acetyl-CoA carboxylase biotin carboxyl carrier protein